MTIFFAWNSKTILSSSLLSLMVLVGKILGTIYLKSSRFFKNNFWRDEWIYDFDFFITFNGLQWKKLVTKNICCIITEDSAIFATSVNLRIMQFLQIVWIWELCNFLADFEFVNCADFWQILNFIIGQFFWQIVNSRNVQFCCNFCTWELCNFVAIWSQFVNLIIGGFCSNS